MVKAKEMPTTPEELTAEWLTAALRFGGAISDSTVISTIKNRFGEDQAFTGGSLIHIAINYDRPEMGAPQSLVAKLAPTDPALLALMKPSNLREVKFYSELSGQSKMAVPFCYYAAAEPNSGKTILLLEDLTGCQTVDYVTGCTPAAVELVIQAFAEIHGRWWNDPLVYRLSGADVIDDFPFADFWDPYPQAVADLLPEVDLPSSFFEMGRLVGEKIQPIMDRLSEIAPLTCIHRDCHVDNILFDQSGPQEKVKILDWQSLGKGRPMYDVGYFMITSVPIETRRQIESAMLDRYYQSLVQKGVSDYSWDQCWVDYRLAAVPKLYATLVATVALDNSTPHKKAYRKTDLTRLLAFFEDHKILSLLKSF